ncbi:cell division protein FtsQ/DivIB [Mangrovihabitans endophyticus]|uniref:Cell division protein FtsQ n=1 Tax=Mangrovihabitans endophyticus TaxID=1751298 RepID=A0A8J3FK31_9ACTN|nr:FtsQ-type POTRA domain-containing protein [Mangrovihabitans endophyticus]GGK70584.1 cell division protein FtsQ [Mangrovihabitans endophyticus]
MSSGGGRNWRLVRADTDAVPSSVRRFMARARHRRLRAALPWGVGAGVLLVLGGLTWMVYGTSLLGVRTVQVAGTRTITPQMVERSAEVAMREPLARVDLDAVRDRVQRLPAVDHAVVSRSWPATLRIEIVEREPVMAVVTGRLWTLVDDDGVAYRQTPDRPVGVPVARLSRPGPHDVNTRAALTVLAALTGELRDQLASITVTAPARIRLQLRDERIVIWGDDTQSGTKAEVATALLRREGATIDVSAPSVVTIR